MTELSTERIGRITGSRVAGILNLSPYTDRAGVLREMVRQRLDAPSEFAGNIATEWGKQNEPAATAEYERYRGVMVHSDQQILIHRTLDYLAVTPDGLVGEHGMVEVKCPFRGSYSSIDERPDYFEQIQLQLEVTDREWCDFVVWRTTGLAVQRVGRDPGWLERRSADLDAFIAEYEDAVYDTDRHAEFLDDPGPDHREDFDWQLAAVEFLEAKAAEDRANKAKEEARLRLIELAAGESTRGAGVLVTHSERKGSIDYSKAAKEHLTGYDLEPYRKATTPVVTVRAAS